MIIEIQGDYFLASEIRTIKYYHTTHGSLGTDNETWSYGFIIIFKDDSHVRYRCNTEQEAKDAQLEAVKKWREAIEKQLAQGT